MPIPPCNASSTIDFAEIGLFAFINTYACDQWAILHIIAPFLLTIITRDPFLAFAFAGIAEIGEVLAYALFEKFPLFVSDSDVVENITGILLDDWLIQGGIGVFLGILFMFLFPEAPRFLRWQDLVPTRGRKRRAGRFFYYLFLLLFLISPTFIYRLETAGGFTYGILIYWGIQIVLVAIHLIIVRGQFYKFWLTALAVSGVLNIQNLFDYLYSSAIQSWLWSGVIALVLLISICIRRVSFNFADQYRRDYDFTRKNIYK